MNDNPENHSSPSLSRSHYAAQLGDIPQELLQSQRAASELADSEVRFLDLLFSLSERLVQVRPEIGNRYRPVHIPAASLQTSLELVTSGQHTLSRQVREFTSAVLNGFDANETFNLEVDAHSTDYGFREISLLYGRGRPVLFIEVSHQPGVINDLHFLHEIDVRPIQSWQELNDSWQRFNNTDKLTALYLFLQAALLAVENRGSVNIQPQVDESETELQSQPDVRQISIEHIRQDRDIRGMLAATDLNPDCLQWLGYSEAREALNEHEPLPQQRNVGYLTIPDILQRVDILLVRHYEEGEAAERNWFRLQVSPEELVVIQLTQAIVVLNSPVVIGLQLRQSGLTEQQRAQLTERRNQLLDEMKQEVIEALIQLRDQNE